MRLLLAAALSLISVSVAHAETTIRVGWCANTVSGGASPFAIAQKMGWFEEKGVKVILTPLPGATDCVKQVATGELPVQHAVDRAGADHSSARCEGETILHDVSEFHVRHRGAGR